MDLVSATKSLQSSKFHARLPHQPKLTTVQKHARPCDCPLSLCSTRPSDSAQMAAKRRTPCANLRPAASFPLLFILLSFPLKATSQSTQDNTQELQILLQIKQEWGNPPSLSSWTTSTPHCNWTGIHCSANGSVTSIELESQNITGPFPAATCRLRRISTIDLGNNSISGTFPTSLYNCSALQYLDLSQNLLVGPLPSDIHRLAPGLTTLILSANNFTGDIPPTIGRLPAILDLYLDYNLFNGSIPVELGNLSTLETLGLANNPFLPASIPSAIGNLSKLSSLWMTSTNLAGGIPEAFSNLTELVHLDLSENSLSGRIPDWIWGLTKLQNLYLYKNNFTGEINATKMGAMGLTRIDVSINQLTGTIPESFGNLQNLSVLFMYFNQLSDQIPPGIGLLPSLTDLRLFNNHLTGPLPPELGNHSLLWNLEVDDNRISGELPESLCAGRALGSLVVFDNNLTGALPASLGSCPTLNNIQIQRNGFSGELPAGIWSIVNLTTVIMHDNALSGTLPDILPWNLTRLDIGNNRFSGSVPSSAGKLLVFSASDNQFSGQIPAGLATGIPQLQTLSLGGNQITGEIPAEISLLKSLADLNLSSNQLSGGIPAVIGSLPVLTSLDLSDNQLSGAIPSEIGNLRLNSLNLSSNDLSGEIPTSLENAAYDRSFLSNPGLCAYNSLLNLRSCGYQSGGSTGLSPALKDLFVVAGAVFLLIAVGFAFLVVRERRKAVEHPTAWKLTSFRSLNFTESTVVRGLTEENLIGSGGSGKVYRITVCGRTGGAVAVKKIGNSKKLDSKLEREFQSEVRILGSIRHTNIVNLLCCISSAESKLLVYEYMEKRSLDLWLHGKKRGAGVPPAIRGGSGRDGKLDWPTRLGIAIGAARGLCYMHHDCNPPIVHRDVKSSNILLDSEFRARIADFGLARMLVKTGELDTASSVAGSFGYMAPECAYARRATEKMDVYSFGVVLLELVTGREANGGEEYGSLAEWAWRHCQMNHKVAGVVDEEIRDPSCLAEIAVVFRLGVICTGTLPSTRPRMKDVLQILLRCEPAAPGDGDKAIIEYDVAPLLQTKQSSRHRKHDEENDDASCNV